MFPKVVWLKKETPKGIEGKWGGGYCTQQLNRGLGSVSHWIWGGSPAKIVLKIGKLENYNFLAFFTQKSGSWREQFCQLPQTRTEKW